MFCNIPVWKLWLIRTNPETPAIRMKILWIWRQLFIKRSKHQTVRRHSETKRRYHRHTKRQYSRGILKKKIQVICWTTSSKVAISNVKHKSGRIIGLAHPARVPNPTPIYRGKCAHGQKFWFLMLSQTISRDHSFESLCCTDFKNVTLYLIETPWKLLQPFQCWVENDSRKET